MVTRWMMLCWNWWHLLHDQDICQHIQTVGFKAGHGPGIEEGDRLAGNTKLYFKYTVSTKCSLSCYKASHTTG
jgi:hypothetical protein